MIRLGSPVFWVLLWGAVLTGPHFSPAAASTDADDSSPISVTARIEPETLTVGDLATYYIVIRHAPEIKINPPDFPADADFKGFDVIDRGRSPQRRFQDQIEDEFWVRLRADRVGFYTLEGPQVAFRVTGTPGPDASIPGNAKAPEVTVQIRSVLFQEGDPKDIRDIKPIIGAGWPWWNQLLLGLAGVMLALFIGWLAHLWVERHRAAPRKPAVPALPAGELALRELAALYQKGWLQQGRLQELCFELSEIFRRYLGTRYGIPALDWTTEEIAGALNRHPESSPETLEHAERILNETDLVKFAKARTGPESGLRLMKSVRSFIKSTPPRPSPPPAVLTATRGAI
ncbi:MAG: hypothetical protein ACE5ER_05275 [Nitrospinaceae bacterium]